MMPAYTRYPVPENLLASLINVESGGNPYAVSRKGARGLGQIMPATAQNPGFNIQPLQSDSPDENKRLAGDYLGALLQKYGGNKELALAAYNAGPGAVDKAGGIPDYPETQAYVPKVLQGVNDDETEKQAFLAWKKKRADDKERQDFMEWKAKRQQVQQQPNTLEWSEVPGEALKNLPSSAGQFATGAAQTVLHPIETAKGLAGVVRGGMQEALPKSVTDYLVSKGITPEARPQFKAVKEDFKKDFSSEEGFKRALAYDPFNTLSTLSMATGGLGLAAKAGGLTKTAAAVNKLSNITNPMTIAGKGLDLAGKASTKVGSGLATVIGGIGTHTGGESLKRAAGAGFKGGETQAKFIANLRDKVDQADIVPKIKGAISDIREQNYQQYLQGMKGIKENSEVLDFNAVEQAVNKSLGQGVYKGRTGASGVSIDVNKSANSVKQQIAELVDEFKKAPKEEFWNPGGFDELKRGIGDIMDNYDVGTPQYRVAKNVYDTVKEQIIQQAPVYSDVMQQSQKGMELVKELERSLKAGNKNSADQTLRAIQGVMRNNANTNYGSRVKNVERLGGDIMEELAGQALNTKMPRGLGGLQMGGVGSAALYTHSPLLAGSLLFQSPRLMGESALLAGRTARKAKAITGNKLVQKAAKTLTPLSVANKLSGENQ